MLWHGPPRHILAGARAGRLTLFTSAILVDELDEVLRRDKFARRLAAAQAMPESLVLGYATLATLVRPAPIGPTVQADRDDDAVLACAVAAQAETIVSGDRHLLELQAFRGIRIRTALEVLAYMDRMTS